MAERGDGHSNDGHSNGDEPATSGLTLRDFLAAHALSGLAAIENGPSWDRAAREAYQAADAMLLARGT